MIMGEHERLNRRPRGHGWWMTSVFTMELRKILSYRADFWVQFIGSLAAQFGVAWFLWKAIYTARTTDTVDLYSFKGMMLYYILAPLTMRIVRGGEMGHISEEIYEGTLNRYLLYPVSFFRYKLAANLAHSLVYALQFAIVLSCVAAWIGMPVEFAPSPASIARGIVTIMVASYLHFVMMSTVELTAFWADNVWSLNVILRFLTGLLGGAMIPLSLFPAWAMGVLYSLPFAYFVSFPVLTLLGLESGYAWTAGAAIMAIWAILLTLAYVAVWDRGKHRYTGVGI